MKISVFSVATVVGMLLSSSVAFAKPLVTVSCPQYVANQNAKIAMSTKNLVCLNSSPKKSGFKETSTLFNGVQAYSKEGFDASGSQGPSTTLNFLVGKTPAHLTYSFNDPSGNSTLRIEIIDALTEKSVDSNFISQKGPNSSGSAYIHRQGLFYLKISAPSSTTVCTSDGGTRTCDVEDITYDLAVMFDEDF